MRMPRKLKIGANFSDILLGPFRLMLQKDAKLAIGRRGERPANIGNRINPPSPTRKIGNARNRQS